MCSKAIFCSKVAQKGKICSRLLEPQKLLQTPKVTQKLPSTIGKGLSVKSSIETIRDCAIITWKGGWKIRGGAKEKIEEDRGLQTDKNEGTTGGATKG